METARIELRGHVAQCGKAPELLDESVHRNHSNDEVAASWRERIRHKESITARTCLVPVTAKNLWISAIFCKGHGTEAHESTEHTARLYKLQSLDKPVTTK